MPSLSYLEPVFLHSGVHSVFSMLSLRSSSLAKVLLLLILILSPLMIWYSGLTALFLFLLAKAALAYLPTALSVALRPLFPFQQTQFVQVFVLKPAPFWMLFAGLGHTNKTDISLLLSDSLSVLSSIFPFTSISVAGTVFSLLFYQATMDPRTFVSPGE